MKSRKIGWTALVPLVLLIGCKSSVQIDHLLGQWEVRDIIRDGKSITNRAFRGTKYTFKEDGKVLSRTFDGDSTLVDYARNGDTLFWVSPERKDFYLIDSLSESYFQFTMDQDGFHSTIIMVKVKTE